uniref:Uncharacterized protein n=1 Tax=Vespula pensylvanica TaxID=30213 RepID=A0A834NEH5_VESPE|nr:hypothetical protein H0235_015172 [Vespula pensylvanica]
MKVSELLEQIDGNVLDRLTMYQGLVIRRHCDSVKNMKKVIWATYYYYNSTDEKPQHQNCPAAAIHDS